MNLSEWKTQLGGGKLSRAMTSLYGNAMAAQHAAARYNQLLDMFVRRFGSAAGACAALFSAPGRVEVGGNHTDHNHGRVLAAAINLDTIAVAEPVAEPRVTIWSEGYEAPFVVDADEGAPRRDEQGTSQSLIRGVAAWLSANGHRVGGFRACVASQVAVGSGLSSSAAFEVLVGTIFNHFYNDGRVAPSAIAIAGRHAENHFFGKPSGLMDQMTSAVGGFVTIDFADPARPQVRQVNCDLSASGLALVVTNTGGSHADLTPHYAAIPNEMKAVARAMGAETLRDVSTDAFHARIGDLRTAVGDRALLRALHFFGDNARVVEQVTALEAGDLPRFLALLIESGRSSWMHLQNCYVPGAADQGLALALALSEEILRGRGAWRVHGGGFAGTILAFVPESLLHRYTACMDGVFGAGAAQILHVRSVGATVLQP